MYVKCLICGKEKISYPSRPRKYCSKECRYKHIRQDPTKHPNYNKKTGKNIICKNCNKEFYANICVIKQGKKYCSRKCNTEYIKKYPEYSANYKTGITYKKCEVCGNITGHNKRFCSKECWNKIKSEERKGLRNTFYNKHHSVKTIKKILVGQRKNSKNGHVYDGIKMRSSWEVLYAKWLDDNNFTWDYEPAVFKFKTLGLCYSPDFFVKEFDCYVEVKGYMRSLALKKIEAFQNKYGKNKLKIVDEKELKKLRLL